MIQTTGIAIAIAQVWETDAHARALEKLVLHSFVAPALKPWFELFGLLLELALTTQTSTAWFGGLG